MHAVQNILSSLGLGPVQPNSWCFFGDVVVTLSWKDCCITLNEPGTPACFYVSVQLITACMCNVKVRAVSFLNQKTVV